MWECGECGRWHCPTAPTAGPPSRTAPGSRCVWGQCQSGQGTGVLIGGGGGQGGDALVEGNVKGIPTHTALCLYGLPPAFPLPQPAPPPLPTRFVCSARMVAAGWTDCLPTHRGQREWRGGGRLGGPTACLHAEGNVSGGGGTAGWTDCPPTHRGQREWRRGRREAGWGLVAGWRGKRGKGVGRSGCNFQCTVWGQSSGGC